MNNNQKSTCRCRNAIGSRHFSRVCSIVQWHVTMYSLVQATVSKISQLWELRDRRLDGWPLMDSPVPTLVITFIYFYFVKIGGPKFMEHRQPFQLRGVMMIYNLFQIVLNGWLFYVISRYGWLSGNYSFICQPVDYSNDEAAVRILTAGYWFYLSKYTDLLDTVFFVLRKKNNQITMLHVIHHGILPTTLWPGVRFVAGGHSSFFAFLNSLVHVVMYFYYFVAALGPQYQKYLGWKKYLTTFQMIQFIAASVHCFQLLFIECDFPIAFCLWIAVHEVAFFFLFANFYWQNYLKKSKGKVAHQKEHLKNK